MERLKEIVDVTPRARQAGGDGAATGRDVAIIGLPGGHNAGLNNAGPNPDGTAASQLSAAQLGGVAIDAESFDAVAAHLLNNAIEASPPGAGVRVEVRREALSMVIDIIDEGPGMSPEFIRDELFRPFASTKGDGHGIGVYQARELLREAGGDLLVLSRVGSGTTMRLLLPIVRAAAVDTPRFAA